MTAFSAALLVGAVALTTAAAWLVDVIPGGDTGAVYDPGLEIVQAASPLALLAAAAAVALTIAAWLIPTQRR